MKQNYFKIKNLAVFLTYVLASSFWIYYRKVAVLPLGFLVVMLIFIIRKRFTKEELIAAIIGLLFIVLEIGPYVSIQHPVYKIGLRFGSEIKTEAEEVVENLSSVESISEKIKLLENTLEIDKQNIDIYNLLGWNLLKLEEIDEAIKYFEMGLAIEDNELLSVNLSIANELNKKNPEYYQYFGSLLLIQEKDYLNAKKYLLKSLSIDGINDEEMLKTIYFNLALCYYNLEDIPFAKMYLEKALALRPDDKKNNILKDSLNY